MVQPRCVAVSVTSCLKRVGLCREKKIYFRDIHLFAVKVPVYSSKDDGTRNYEKTDFCLFCGRQCKSGVRTHYMNVHSHEELVQTMKALPLKSLDNEGD